MSKSLCTILFLLLTALPAVAAEAVFGTPVQVLLSPRDAQITAEQDIAITAGQDGRAEARFLLPQGATDVSIAAQGRAVEDWSSATTYLDSPVQAQHERRAALTKELTAVEGEILAIQARLELWKTGNAKELAFADLDKRDNKMRQIIPELHIKLHDLGERAEALKAERDSLPAVGKEAVLVAVSLSGPAKGTVKLTYSYTAGQCGWRPLYRFTALPDKDAVLAQLGAEIWQNSGQDWNNADITLVSHNTRQQAPANLFPWLLDNTDTRQRKEVAENKVMMMEVAAPAAPAQKPAPAIEMLDRGAFASWQLGKRALREGASRLTIREAQWKAPIFWLARPAEGRETFISARCAVEDPRAWPNGSASYFLDGAAVGEGAFALDGNKANLFFGVDPRVTVEREMDARQSGKSGIIIGKRQSWEWNWTFKAFNGRSKPILLRVEDAQPQSGDKEITVTMNSKPEYKLGEDHTLYWELTVPANQGMTISHAVTVAAPADMQVNPGR
jgi:uncharacterized protein (TIGR02231 family)